LKLTKVTEVTEATDMNLNRPMVKNMYSAIIDVIDRRYTNNTTLMV
jgi:hypothetical protein